MNNFAAYADFESFWAKFSPKTPYGREVHEKQDLFFDAAELKKIYDQTDALLALRKELCGDPSRLSLISHHLKQLPRISEHGQSCLDEIDLFQVKKFLHNYHGLMDQLPEDVRRRFGFQYCSHALEEQLNLGQQSAETFYIADEYSSELSIIRAEILQADAGIKKLEEDRRAEIRDKFGFSFEDRAFLLVPKESVKDLASASKLMAIDPYDDLAFSVRPLECVGALTLAEKRQELAQQERISEEAVLESLSKLVRAELPNLTAYRQAALAFDLAWARADMAMEHSLIRPKIHKKNHICVQNGIYIPCQSLCSKHGLPYTPLDATFQAGSAVIYGSNMGGKTVVLQTLAFLQLAAQSGLFVPASRFETRIFNNFHYIGERRGDSDRQTQSGLSGFAIEMQQLMEAWRSIDADQDGTLLLMDEFARTTSSTEAEALLTAVLETIAKKTNTIALCSTHFHRLPRLPEVRFLRMSGLSQCLELRAENLEIKATSLGNEAKNSAINEIAKHMTYSLVPDNGNQCSDAIAVARMLGVDEKLVDRANFFFQVANP
ncbi:MAG: hypothetical protein FWG12_03005 [Holophagaceae bacterium]|nr:hypothetical protein [Holophagaceae bacterium]